MNQVDPHDECHIDILSVFTLDPLCHQCDITCAFFVQILYSGLFVRFAWAVQPRNYILASCLELSPWRCCHTWMFFVIPKKRVQTFQVTQPTSWHRATSSEGVLWRHKKRVRIREEFFSIELGIYIYVDLEFQLWFRWGEHKIATEPETGATTVRLGSKLGWFSVLVGLSCLPLSGAEAMKTKSLVANHTLDQTNETRINSWYTRWTRDNKKTSIVNKNRGHLHSNDCETFFSECVWRKIFWDVKCHSNLGAQEMPVWAQLVPQQASERWLQPARCNPRISETSCFQPQVWISGK